MISLLPRVKDGKYKPEPTGINASTVQSVLNMKDRTGKCESTIISTTQAKTIGFEHS